MQENQVVNSSHETQGATEKKKRYQIRSHKTTVYYHYVDAESVEQVRAMIANFWEKIPDAEHIDDVDSFETISAIDDETTEQ